MHRLQKILLKRLVYSDPLRYADLTKGFDYDDNILFHVKQLLNRGLLLKKDRKYFLSPEGLIISGKFDLESLEDQEYKNLYIGFLIKINGKYILREQISNDKTFYKLPGGKPIKGENMEVARRRLFEREVALKNPKVCRFKYLGTHAKIQYTSDGAVLFDDILLVFEEDLPLVAAKDITLLRQNKLFTTEEIKSLSGKWPEIDICIFNKDWIPYIEYTFTNDYNLSVE